MSKKLLSLMVAALLFTGAVIGSVQAAGVPQPGAENVIIENSPGASNLIGRTVVVKVRYARQGANDAKLSSGDVVVWDLNSMDGVTISGAIVTSAVSYAGVLVTDVLTADDAGVINPSSRNWGYMAIRGYALAHIDTSSAATGESLVVNGATESCTFGTYNSVATAAATVTKDIGVLLYDSGSDGLLPVMLQ